MVGVALLVTVQAQSQYMRTAASACGRSERCQIPRAETSDCDGGNRRVPDGSHARYVNSKKEIYFLPS